MIRGRSAGKQNLAQAKDFCGLAVGEGDSEIPGKDVVDPPMHADHISHHCTCELHVLLLRGEGIECISIHFPNLVHVRDAEVGHELEDIEGAGQKLPRYLVDSAKWDLFIL